MQNIDIVVMGKTGAGKSTLINALLGSNEAPTGRGEAVTLENKLYEKRISDTELLRLYDTVGLELDSKITDSTIEKIKQHLKSAFSDRTDDQMSVVWFCVNANSNRFEEYELELIRKLSFENSIPFLIVVTQCYENEEKEFEKSVKQSLPEIPLVRVLAEDYQSRIGTFKAYGVQELLELTKSEYPKLQIHIAEEKLNKLHDEYEKWKSDLERRGKRCVEEYSDKAMKIGFLPLGCIPVVHGLCIKMVSELNGIFGIRHVDNEKLADFVIGLISTPFMAVPLLSAAVATAYVQTVGEDYLACLMNVAKRHANLEIEDQEQIVALIKKNLKKK